MQTEATPPGVWGLTCHKEEVILAEAKEFSSGDQPPLLLGCERGQQVVMRVRSVMDIVMVPPAPGSRGGEATLGAQLALRDTGGCSLDLGPIFGVILACLCSLMFMNLLSITLVKEPLAASRG